MAVVQRSVVDGDHSRSEELPREIEPEIQAIRKSATRKLSEGGGEPIREIELKHVPADALLNREAVLGITYGVSGKARRDFGSDINARRHSQPAAQAEKARVSSDTRHGGTVVNPDGRDIQRGSVANDPGDDSAQRRGVIPAKIVRAFDRYERRR